MKQTLSHFYCVTLLIFLSLPLTSRADDVRFDLSMRADEIRAHFKKLSAADITKTVGWKIRPPLKSTFWELRDYDIVIELSEREGKLESLSYWKKTDFTDKTRRSETQQGIVSLTIDTATGKFLLEKDQRNK